MVFRRKLLYLSLWFSSLLVLGESRIFAYPFLVAEGYTTCATCHYNPSGGGSLTPYGKFIAQELLGTWNDSSSALPWIVKPDTETQVVASVLLRGAQTHFDTPQVTRSAFRKMQADLELGWVHADGWQILGAVGPQLDAAGEDSKEAQEVFARRFWVGQVKSRYALRIGKFFPEYGIAFPNHNIATRKGLYFNHNQEPYLAQGTYFGDFFDLTFGLLEGAKDTALAEKQGYSSTVAYRDGTFRVGMSRLDAKKDKERSEAQGIFGQVGYFKKGYTLVDIHYKRERNILGRESRSDLAYAETGWAVIKGVQPFLASEYSYQHRTRLKIATGFVGLQLHPWTHTELVLQWGESMIRIYGENEKARQGVAMFHVYF
jgi:hypothetical protein